MFDRHFHVLGGSQDHYHRHEVHEHRAPTDKSVELLKEMESKAVEKVLSSVRLEGCEVSCVVHHMHDVMGLDDRFVIQYQLGGKRHTIKHTALSRVEHQAERRQRVADELVKVLSEHIAVQLLIPAMQKAGREMFAD